MSDYGFRIYNYSAGTVYSVMLGVRDEYKMTKAMLTHSLFTDFICDNGLEEYNGATRDIIGINFDFGSRSYEDERKHVEKLLKSVTGDDEGAEELRERHRKRLDEIDANKDKFDRKTAAQIRHIFYKDGLDIIHKSKNGKVKIHYRMLYRTPGKAKKGSCMFIRDELYETARNFLYMGIELPEHDAPIVEIGAYSSLSTSTIIDKIMINPDDILILKDVKSAFQTTAISIETDEHKQCRAVRKENYEVTNELFDGQALIDLSIFPDYGNGYVLLRHHFTKMAAFATDIQGFFKDHFGDRYETATVTDMFGIEHPVKSIKMITTNNATKWLKFDIGETPADKYRYWCDRVHENGCMFGVVKTAHPSKLGDVQRMSYQMVNALDEDTVDSVMSVSVGYIEKLKTDTEVFLDYLRRNATFANDYEVLVALYEQDHEFERSEYFRSRRAEIIRSYVFEMKNGRLIQNGDNLVIVGSPYAMLLHSVGVGCEYDVTFSQENGCIQCYSERFADGAYLAGFRNPFNSRNNLGYYHNHYHAFFRKYFRFGQLVIAVNMIHTDFQPRNNGSDQDSDSLYVTDQKDIVSHAAWCYANYPTIVNNIPPDSNHYDNTPENFAIIDNKLAASQGDIGESSNLAQICLTYTYNFDDPMFEEYVCILATLAQVAIDSAKRTFPVVIKDEIERIRQDINLAFNRRPAFWTIIRRGVKPEKINKDLKCPMNHIFGYQIGKPANPEKPTLPMSAFFVKYEMDMDRRISKKIEKLIQDYSLDVLNYRQKVRNRTLEPWDKDDGDHSNEYLVLRDDFEKLIQDIRDVGIPKKYLGLMSWLIDRAFMIVPQTKGKSNVIQSKLDKNRALLLKTLYTVNPEALLKCFAGNV